MASLKGLLTTRNPAEMIENNLETGYIYSYTSGTNYTKFCNGICWTANVYQDIFRFTEKRYANS